MKVCPVCGEVVDIFTHVHARRHGCKTKEIFYRKYGEPKNVKNSSNPKFLNAKQTKWIRDNTPNIHNGSYNNGYYMKNK